MVNNHLPFPLCCASRLMLTGGHVASVADPLVADPLPAIAQPYKHRGEWLRDMCAAYHRGKCVPVELPVLLDPRIPGPRYRIKAEDVEAFRAKREQENARNVRP